VLARRRSGSRYQPVPVVALPLCIALPGSVRCALWLVRARPRPTSIAARWLCPGGAGRHHGLVLWQWHAGPLPSEDHLIGEPIISVAHWYDDGLAVLMLLTAHGLQRWHPERHRD